MKEDLGSFMFRKTPVLMEQVAFIMRCESYATYAEMFRDLVRRAYRGAGGRVQMRDVPKVTPKESNM